MDDSKGSTLSIVTLHMEVVKEIKLHEEVISTQYKAGDIFISEIGNKDKEHFCILCLDSKGKPTHFEIVHIGTLNQTLIHPREIFKTAILSNASSIIVGHNHPSGDLIPSSQDLKNTKHIVQAGSLLGVTVLDHIIVNDTSIHSIRNKQPYLFERSDNESEEI
ncbi:MAG: JAB domain-containing protein [Candidatus Izimaplasma sp.]|nr:JAB domain-containing protein [Candidatus Izimaplasma bacterium]